MIYDENAFKAERDVLNRGTPASSPKRDMKNAED